MIRSIKYKISNSYIYSTIIAASIFYECYIKTSEFVFRSLSIASITLFYFILILYFLERKKNIFTYQAYNKNKLLYLYVLITTILVVPELILHTSKAITLFFNPYSFLAYFIAFTAITTDNNSVQDLRKISIKINNLFIIFITIDIVIFNNSVILHDLHYFILIELVFTTRKKLTRAIYLLSLVTAVILIENYYDHRTIILRMILATSIFLPIYFFRFLENTRIKYLILIACITFFLFIVLDFSNTFNYLVSFIKTQSISTTDTRSFLYIEFFQDFKGTDWIFGKGYLGTYFSQWFFDWQGDAGDHYQRFSLEVAVLQILLKGGLVCLIPFLIILIKSLKKGFIENNISSGKFRLSILLLTEFIILGIENIPTFGTHFMLIWLIIGIITHETSNSILKYRALNKNQLSSSM